MNHKILTPAEDKLEDVNQRLGYAADRLAEAQFEVEEFLKRKGRIEEEQMYWQGIVALEKSAYGSQA